MTEPNSILKEFTRIKATLRLILRQLYLSDAAMSPSEAGYDHPDQVLAELTNIKTTLSQILSKMHPPDFIWVSPEEFHDHPFTEKERELLKSLEKMVAEENEIIENLKGQSHKEPE